MFIHLSYFYVVCVLGCFSLILLAYATRNLVVFNRHIELFRALEDAPFIHNIYNDAKQGTNKGLADCILKSFIPGYNTVVLSGVVLSLMLVIPFLTLNLLYTKAKIKLTKFLDKVLSKTFTVEKKDVLQ